MTLPSGTIYMSQINAELGRGSTNYISMGNSGLRGLAGVSSGPIYMSQLRGKSSYTAMNASNVDVYDERQVAVGGSNYTSSWSPGVNVSGGSGGYSFSWSFTSGTNGFTLSNASGQYCTVSYLVARFGGSSSCTLNCQITDNTGHQVNVNVNVYFNYYTE